MSNVASALAKSQLHYNEVAALAFMTWDVLVHIDEEAECIWRGRHSWIDWIYLFIRYAPIFHGGAILTLRDVANYSTTSCRAWLIYQSAFMEGLIIATEFVLMLRLYSLYNDTRPIQWTILSAFLGEIAVMVIALCLSLPRIEFGASDCYIAHTPDMFMLYWLACPVFEAFLFALTVSAFCRNSMRNLGKRSLLFLFLRDGAWAFTIIFVAMSMNTLMYELFTDSRAGMGYLWALAVMSFTGSHVILNIRCLSRQDCIFSERMSSIEFQRTELEPHHSVRHQSDNGIPLAEKRP